MSQERAEKIAAVLEAALTREPTVPPSPARDGYQLVSVTPRFLMGRHLPVVTFAREGRTLAFIVAPTNLDERVFKRSARLDITYFSEDAPDDRQQGVYDENRAMIERFSAWVLAWDARGEELP